MSQAALRVAKLIRHEGVSTVEFMVDLLAKQTTPVARFETPVRTGSVVSVHFDLPRS